MQLPIVATNIRGSRQVVDDGVTGRLVRGRDSHALAKAIGELVDDADSRRRMGLAARQKAVRDFDQHHVIDVTLDVYNGLLRERGLERIDGDRLGRPVTTLELAAADKVGGVR